MSVIVKDLQTGKLVLLCKGADSIIADRLNTQDSENIQFLERTMAYVKEFATEGLRTLLLA